ncbi:MAG: efflux RND transporter permease subunit, partial [Gammaproteobacteria bacterium]|nr:efflux RND transporter permease subunit [Gammaproteobacteria bacterium]
MITYFTRHPTAGNILMMAIIAIGLVSMNYLNRETFPQLKPSKVEVRVLYPGASPSDVEDAICNRLEDATDGISYLYEQSCDARDNLAIFTLEMLESGDMRAFTDDIRTAVDGISDFPADVEDPVVTQLGRTSQVATVAVTSEKLTAAELKSLTEYYRDRLLAIHDIPIVSLDGFADHQLQILVDPDARRKYGLGIQEVAALVASQALELPAGDIDAESATYQVRFENARKTVEQLEDLVVLGTDNGGEVRLGEIARIEDRFENPEDRVELNGKMAGLLRISKNTADDTLTVYDALDAFITEENARLPESTRLTITQDSASIVRDRLQLLLTNGWQGLILATLTLLLFFSWRYTFWVALGLPVSFLGGLAMMVMFGISINMISMVALLMAIGILMDDAIVLSESIAHEYKKGKSAMQAAIDGTHRVIGGVFASYLTSACLFGSLLMMKGDMGQILGVLPVVLLSVLTVSLIEAFLVLPHHLLHSLEHAENNHTPTWRMRFENGFGHVRERVGRLADTAIRFRYVTVGIAFALLILSVGLIATGMVKFKAFPDIEGNQVQARVLLSQSASLADTEAAMQKILRALDDTVAELDRRESSSLVKSALLTYGVHGDVPESGAHLATLSLDLLNTEERVTTIEQLTRLWRQNAGDLPGVLSVQFRESAIGPAGRAIEIRLIGDDLQELSDASWKLQAWLQSYKGVSNLLDDLRPGIPQFAVSLKPGALAAGLDAQSIASELRAAYQGARVDDIYHEREAYEIIAKIDNAAGDELAILDDFTLFSKTGEAVPLASVANLHEQRDFSRIARVNRSRTVTISGDVDAALANTGEIIAHMQSEFLPELQARYPGIRFALKGEVESGDETKFSILSGFGLGLLGVFLLLSFIFRNYREPAL